MSSSKLKDRGPLGRKELLTAAGAGVALLVVGKAGKAAAAVGGKALGPKWAMAVDLRRCTGCRTCSVACKAENEVPLGVFRTSVHYLDVGKYPNAARHMAPVRCNHCENPPCVEVCPVDAVKAVHKRPDGVEIAYNKKASHKRPDGVVLTDAKMCIGCHQCVEACPYKARYVDPVKKAGANPSNSTIGKCTYCVQRVDNGVEPSCVQSCVGRALIFGDLNNPSSDISQALADNNAKTWKPGEGTKPNSYFIGLEDKNVLGEEVHSL